MTLPAFLDSLTDLSAALARRSNRRSRTLPVHVVLMLLLVAEGNQRGETVTVAALMRLLGLNHSSVVEGVGRLVDAGLLDRAPKRPKEVHRALAVTAVAVDLLRRAFLSPVRTVVFPSETPATEPHQSA